MNDQHVQQVRELVLAQLDAEHATDTVKVMQLVADSATVKRFIRATGGSNYAAAAKRLVTTSRWRLKERPEQLTCKTCEANAKAHFMHSVGHDLRGRPVLFSSHIMIGDAEPHGATQHMLCEFERAIKLMPLGVESWVWIMDFRGYGRRLADLSPTLAINFLHLSSAHYPERLGALWILDAPAVLMPVYRWLKPMMDPVTHAKFRFLPFDVPATGPLPPYAAPTASPTTSPTTSPTSESTKPLSASATASTTAAAPTTSAASEAADAADGAAAAAAPIAAAPQASTAASLKPSVLWSALCEVCDAALATWIVDEMRAARAWDDRKKSNKGPEPTRPVYDLQALEKALQESAGVPELLARLGSPADVAPGGLSRHSSYGTEAFLARLLEAAKGGAAAGPAGISSAAEGSDGAQTISVAAAPEQQVAAQ